MSVTIDSLDIQIRSSAGSAASNIDKLADSLERLQQNAKLTVVSNNLTKLSNALSQLQVNSASLSAIKGLAGAMKSLSGIEKSAGLNSTLNSLKKLPEIVNGLDSGTLDQFSAKMRELSAALAPLSKQLSKVSTAFSKLPTRVRDMVSGVNKLKTATDKATQSQRKHNDSLDKQGINLMAAISNIQSYMGALQSVGQHISTLMADAIEWDGIQFRFGRAFGEDAEEVYAYAQKINDVLGINLQQFMQYSSLYGSLLSGFGMAQEKVTAISVGLTELSYDIWAAYNDRFKTLEQASEAVRSAITGEIEPIRNAGIALTEASLQEYLDSVGMATVSIEKLSEAQKAEIRYAAMVNAAMQQGIVGTYAKEMDTAEGAVRNLTQQLKTLGQALGSIFLPILQVVVPWLTAFVELIYEGAVAFMALLGIPFQEIKWDSASSGVGGLADSANEATGALGSAAKQAKKLKDYTMGFDELNVINPNSGSTGSGGAGGSGDPGWGTGLELDTLWDESLFANASKKVDELKTKIKEWFDEWKEEIAIVSAALALMGVAKLISNLSTVLGQMSMVSKLATTAMVITLQYSIMSEYLENYIEDGEWEDYIKAAAVAALGAFASYAMWGKKGLVISLGVTALVSLKATFEDGNLDSAEEAVTGVTGLAAGLGALGMAWKALGLSKLAADIGAFFALLFEGNSLGAVLAATFPKLANTLGAIGGAIMSVLTAIATALGISVGWVVAIIAAVVALGVAVVVFWDEIKYFFTDILPQLWGKFVDWLGGIVTAIGKAIQPIIDFLAPIWEAIKEVATLAYNKVKEIVVGIGKAIWSIVTKVWEVFKKIAEIFVALWGAFKEYVLNPIGEVIAGVAKKFYNKVLAPIGGFFKGVGTWVYNKIVKPVWDKIVWLKNKAVEIFKAVGTTVVNFVSDTFKSVINSILWAIERTINGFLKMLNGAIDLINKIPNVNITKVELLSIPRLADGGFVGAGQMFIAREAGPELVGNIGNRTAVANNDQIIEGIAAGVYRAVVSAMSDTSGQQSQNVNVYLDGKQIYASVKKTESQRGRTLMGNQLGYSY